VGLGPWGLMRPWGPGGGLGRRGRADLAVCMAGEERPAAHLCGWTAVEEMPRQACTACTEKLGLWVNHCSVPWQSLQAGLQLLLGFPNDFLANNGGMMFQQLGQWRGGAWVPPSTSSPSAVRANSCCSWLRLISRLFVP